MEDAPIKPKHATGCLILVAGAAPRGKIPPSSDHELVPQVWRAVRPVTQHPTRQRPPFWHPAVAAALCQQAW